MRLQNLKDWKLILMMSATLLASQGASAGISKVTTTSDSTNVYFQFSYSDRPNFFRVYLDTDRNQQSGYGRLGIGADYLIENTTLYRYSGTNGSWLWTPVKPVSMRRVRRSVKWVVAKSDLRSPSSVALYGEINPPFYRSAVAMQTLAEPAPFPQPVPLPLPVPAPQPAPTPQPVPASTGAIYYLSPSGNDSNPGTQSAPWRTIQKAANTLVAGETVILKDGLYEEPSINFRNSGTASKPITFAAENKWQAILSSTSGCNPGFSISASYITVKGIRFSVSPNNITCPQYTSANVAIRAWESVEATPSNPTTGLIGFHADGIKVDADLRRSDGAKSNQDFTIFENSEFGLDVEVFNSKNSIIRNNVVVGQNKFGISILAKGGVRNAQIYNNIVHNKVANGWGVIVGGYSCDACHFDTTTNIEAYNSVAYNNVVINESNGVMLGLVMEGAQDSAFFNNVIIGGQYSMQLGGHNSGPQAPNLNPVFKNNIFVCNGGSVLGPVSYAGTLSMDYNNFANCTGVPPQAHPIIGDPQFMNPNSDWHLQAGSPAINSGEALTFIGYDGSSLDISHDKDGVVRTSPWDLGIYNVAP